MNASVLQRFFRRGAAPGWLVVGLEGSTVSLAHVVANGGMPAVEFAEAREWDPAEPKSLERVAREFGAKRFRCTTLLKPQEYNILLVEAPAVKPEELRAAVRWRVKDMLDYHVDDATIDVLDVPVPAGAGAQRVHYMYAVAARNDTVRATIERFAAGGMPLQVIDIPDTAQRNVAARLESDQRGVVALSFDAQGGLVTVSHAGELYLSRRLDITDAQLAADDDARARVLERVLAETQRSLDHCERTYPFFALGRVLVGPVAGEGLLREHLAANLYLPVESLELAKVFRLPAASRDWAAAEQAKWLKLFGAGLRVEKKAL